MLAAAIIVLTVTVRDPLLTTFICAAGLAADAKRAALVIKHQDRFNRLSIGQLKEYLLRVCRLRNNLRDQSQGIHACSLGQQTAQGSGQVMHLLEIIGKAFVAIHGVMSTVITRISYRAN